MFSKYIFVEDGVVTPAPPMWWLRHAADSMLGSWVQILVVLFYFFLNFWFSEFFLVIFTQIELSYTLVKPGRLFFKDLPKTIWLAG